MSRVVGFGGQVSLVVFDAQVTPVVVFVELALRAVVFDKVVARGVEVLGSGAQHQLLAY